PLVAALRPAVLDCHVAAFHIAGFLQALMECGHHRLVAGGRGGVEKPEHRQRRLLRAGGERDDRRNAAQQREELTPVQLAKLHPISTGSDRPATYRNGRELSGHVLARTWPPR